ncbi:hypothetical protein [Exiguobacterium artemiae]|uniref:hypothetical protein n=1 Tax=Exiguobacterium artemiae TaxID=340145 RepID=UPI003D093D7D
MVNIGSVLLILFLIFGNIKYNTKELYYVFLLKVLIVFSLYIQIGYFIQIGSFQLEYSELLMIIIVVLGFSSFKNGKVPILSWLVFLGLMMSIVLGYFSLIFSQENSLVLAEGGSWDQVVWGNQFLTEATFTASNIMKLLRILVFILLFWIIDMLLSQKNYIINELKIFTVNAGVVFAGIALIEQITKTILKSTVFLDVTTSIFGVAASQVTKNFERGGLFALQGMTFEPSVFALSFLPPILLLLTSSNFKEIKKFSILSLFIYVIICSGSFGGFALVAFFVGVYLFSNKKLIFMKIFCFSGLIILMVIIIKFVPIFNEIFSYYFERIFSFVNSTGLGSETSRLYSVSIALNAFKNNILFGIGLGSLDVHGFIPSLVSNIGLVGCLFFVLLLFKGSSNSKPKNILLFLYMLPFLYLTGSLRLIYSMHIMILFLLVFREHSQKEELEKVT